MDEEMAMAAREIHRPRDIQHLSMDHSLHTQLGARGGAWGAAGGAGGSLGGGSWEHALGSSCREPLFCDWHGQGILTLSGSRATALASGTYTLVV